MPVAEMTFHVLAPPPGAVLNDPAQRSAGEPPFVVGEPAVPAPV